MLKCPDCGTLNQNNAAKCACGYQFPLLDAREYTHLYRQNRCHESQKRILPALILCLAGGLFGLHRFYVGKAGTGILQLITGGGCFVWTFIDFVMIVTGNFTDSEGNEITRWT